MAQRRLVSALEAGANVAVGFVVSAVLTALVLPAFGYPVRGADALGIAAVFTAASLVRGYVLRRLFVRLG